MDFQHGFTLMHELGMTQQGGYLPFAALTAIHQTHRLVAFVVLAAMALLAWRLRGTPDAALRRWAWAVGGVALWQFATGLGNVVLGWPLLGAVAHTGGAAVWVALLAVLLTRAHLARPATERRLRPGAPLRAAP
jgi:cytochrome c oxidase assembly protein subunit 15